MSAAQSGQSQHSSVMLQGTHFWYRVDCTVSSVCRYVGCVSIWCVLCVLDHDSWHAATTVRVERQVSVSVCTEIVMLCLWSSQCEVFGVRYLPATTLAWLHLQSLQCCCACRYPVRSGPASTVHSKGMLNVSLMGILHIATRLLGCPACLHPIS